MAHCVLQPAERTLCSCPRPRPVTGCRTKPALPDGFVYRIPADGIVRRDWSIVRELVLAIEVLSPSTARYDRGLKRHFYLRSPTDEYWIVDIDSRVIERWRRGDERPEILTEALAWRPAGVDEALRVELGPYLTAARGSVHQLLVLRALWSRSYTAADGLTISMASSHSVTSFHSVPRGKRAG